MKVKQTRVSENIDIFSQLDLNLIRVFCTVCELNSITLAAEKLDLTQSSVSNALIRLKKTLGCELFIRVGRGILPTSTGYFLYESLSPLMTQLAQTLQSVQDFDPKLSIRVFQVYANEVLIDLLQPVIYQALQDTNIEVIFREAPLSEEQLYEGLSHNKVDLALDIALPHYRNVKHELIAQETLACIVRQDHPEYSDSISFEQFFNAKHVLYKMRRENKTVTEFSSIEKMPMRNVYSEQSSLLSMMSMVSKSDAIGISSQTYAKNYAKLFNLQILPLPFEIKPINVYSIWTTRYHKDKASQWLREFISESMAESFG